VTTDQLVRDLAGQVTPEQGWLLVQVRSWQGEEVPSMSELARLARLSPVEVLEALGGLSRMGLLAGTILAVD
jgi:hypothetical protein